MGEDRAARIAVLAGDIQPRRPAGTSVAPGMHASGRGAPRELRGWRRGRCPEGRVGAYRRWRKPPRGVWSVAMMTYGVCPAAGRSRGEDWADTLRREVGEEARATVTGCRLLGFGRGVCVRGRA